MSTSSKSELRVLELISTPMRFNGQTLFAMRIVRHMKRVRADFLTYFVGDERIREDAAAMGSAIHVAPSRMRNPVGYIRFVSNLIRREGYSIVHCHGNSCTLAIDLLAAKLGGAKVRIAHSHNSQCKFALLHKLLRPLFNRLYTHAMACGDEAGRWLFGKKPFTVVQNAIDTRSFAFNGDVRESLRKEFCCEDRIVIGSVANLTEVKNHAFLLRAFAEAHKRNPSLMLMLVGDGPLRESHEQLARELGIADSVRFLGWRSDVSQLIQMMDVMALPSLFEGFPTVALEWQCAGLPVLMADTITTGCAFTRDVRFLPLNEDAWTNAMLDTPAINRASASRSGITALTQAGFDLSAAAKALEDDYFRFAR